MISQCDLFVLYDDMQYTRRDWRNRNKIKTPQGLQWLTIPVDVKGKYLQRINETKVKDESWAGKHLKSIQLNYKKAPSFDEWFPNIEAWYKEAEKFEYLSEINTFFIEKICAAFDIHTKIVSSSLFQIDASKTEALVSVLDQLEGCKTYLSGPAAKDYLDITPFKERNISVEWMDYSGYSEYEQVWPPFEHGVSILDILLHVGANRSLLNLK